MSCLDKFSDENAMSRMLCCLCICPDAYARQYLNILNLIGFEYFGALDQMCLLSTDTGVAMNEIKIKVKQDMEFKSEKL